MKKIHGHSIEETLLEPGGWVLDLGCRDFVFSKKLLSYGMRIIAVDPLRGMKASRYCLGNNGFYFLNKACVGVKNLDALMYFEYKDGGANSLYNKTGVHMEVQGKSVDFIASYPVDLITIREIMDLFNVVQFDVIKMDIEGAEYDILLNFPTRCTKQLTVEFHDWLGLNPEEDVDVFYNFIETTTLSDYEVKLKKKVAMSGRGTYSDVLYVLK
jgi:FkbM family methyltransferase